MPTINYTYMSNAIRALAIDAVQQANSGHPGMPMGMADIATVLWHKHLNITPKDINWLNRDRFILSNGHGSMLLYALLHLTGFDLNINELKNFRQLHSKTPGHPEYGITAGVETSTGPLGQGLANAVGMALAQSLLANEFNRHNYDIINHYTYAFVGDGCLMEGISHEAASLAGVLNLSKLIVIYDDNGISIDGKVQAWFNDNTEQRFLSYGWNVINNVDGHDIASIDAAIMQAKTLANNTSKPTIICCKTMIGKGSPNLQDTDKIHGSPLGKTEIDLTKQSINWQHQPFEIPSDLYSMWQHRPMQEENYKQWQQKFDNYTNEHPQLAAELIRRLGQELPINFNEQIEIIIQTFQHQNSNIATRKSSQNCIEKIAELLPELLGGSADLTSSNLTNWPASTPVRANQFGNHINYGVREFAMSAMINGISLYGGYIPFGGTFLTFSDYSRNALRMAALMKIRSIFIFTHDSIGLGEDGPTHQPIEHIASLRLMPNMHVWRPADSVETMVAWHSSIKNLHTPSSLILSRQNLPCLAKNTEQIQNIYKGGYIIDGSLNSEPNITIIATGSEVSLALEVKKILCSSQDNLIINVVSMPCLDVFEQQSSEYKQQVLNRNSNSKIIAIEAGVSASWYKYADTVFGIDQFGESAPAGQLFDYFGLTAIKIASKISIA